MVEVPYHTLDKVVADEGNRSTGKGEVDREADQAGADPVGEEAHAYTLGKEGADHEVDEAEDQKA